MLEVSHVSKYYENQLLLDDISFEVAADETVCLLGPSGGGKSTLLRIIAGLEGMESGRILWQGQDLADVPVHIRRFGLMFQDYALFPHMTVAENIAFGLRMQGIDPEIFHMRVSEALELVNLQGFGGRRVTDLSGGEQQRVALARALVPQPRLLMLDEPLGALDRALREQLGGDLRRVLNSMDIPVIYVTHDQEEAFAIADRLLILHESKIIQSGSPEEVYNRPASLWLAAFFGQQNRITGKVESIQPLIVRTEVGTLDCACEGDDFRVGQDVTLVLPPHTARMGEEGKNILSARVQDSIFQGDGFMIDFLVRDGLELSFRLEKNLPIGSQVNLTIQPESILCFHGGEHAGESDHYKK